MNLSLHGFARLSEKQIPSNRRYGPWPSFMPYYIAAFEHIDDGLWNLIPVSKALLRRTSALMVSAARDLFIRTADEVHFTTAHEIGERAV